MSFGGRMLASSERERTAYIPLGTHQPREILIGQGSPRKSSKTFSRQRICVLCGTLFLLMAIGALISDREKVSGSVHDFAIGTWDRLATGTSWLAGRPPKKGPFQGAASIRPLASEMVQLIKSSSALAAERLSWHVMWARPDIPKRLLYSDADMRLGAFDVYDALANTTSATFRASDEFQEYNLIHKQLANGQPVSKQAIGTKARQLDKWKLLPMLAHAWKAYPNQKWYVASEDDTYVFFSTLVRWLSQFDPSELKYFGNLDKGGDGTFEFANIGAGLVLSQKIMQQTFGKDELFHTKWDTVIKKWSCGDCALADVLYQQPQMKALRPVGGHELFVKESVRSLIFTDELLYAPVLSLHHNEAFDLQALRVFEEQVLPTLDEDDGIRYCDLLEHFAPATLGMNVRMHLKTLEEGKTLHTSGLDTDVVKQGCEGAFRLGQPTLNVTSGWKVGRIASLFHRKPCKDKERRKAEPIAAPWGSVHL
ncbi:unnamed protein product [Tilletia laevis]|nr:unnamed protein product [Tilletia laevis]CAD6975626.1 unnamed protein product [Tilletia controversa]